ncbi:MAG TPA: hypothetical protein VF156_15645 [Agromyces sp.]
MATLHGDKAQVRIDGGKPIELGSWTLDVEFDDVPVLGEPIGPVSWEGTWHPAAPEHVQFQITVRCGYMRAECTCGWFGQPRVADGPADARYAALCRTLEDFYRHRREVG